jgi:hypothetical protein
VKDLVDSTEFYVDYGDSRTVSFGWLFQDEAYLNSVFLTTSAMTDYLMKRPPAKTTYFYLRKTISLLNNQLSSAHGPIADSTVAVVLCLIRLAAGIRDFAAVDVHFTGLQRILRLRGGLEGVLNMKLRIKLCR